MTNKPENTHEIGWTKGLLLLVIVLNFTGLFVPIMAPDGALYSSIAKTMAQRNNFIELFAGGTDWLDKPHFPFWVAALSFKLFGFYSWSYKLPAILFLLLGARYTFLFAQQFYTKETSLWAAIILLTAEHIVISNNDVRAEPYLTGLVIGSVYHFYKAIDRPWLKQLVMGAMLAAAAIMTKGVFALVPICGAIAGGLVLSKQGKKLLHVKWLLGFLLVVVFIMPELFCLWYQFDRLPEKLVFGHNHVSGLKFFFWDSQFGRFTNTGPIRGEGDISFFLHTILWAFLPWSALFYAAVGRKAKAAFRKEKTNAHNEWFTLSGAALTFLLFSLSRFQLPHYTNIIFPFFAIATADYLHSTRTIKTIKKIEVLQTIIVGLLWVFSGVVQFCFQPASPLWWVICFLIGLLLIIRIKADRRIGGIVKVFRVTALTSILVNLFLNLVFYPALLKYQAGSELAFYLNKHYDGQPVVFYLDRTAFDLQFYLHGKALALNEEALKSRAFNGSHLMFISVDDAQKLPFPFERVASFQHFPVSRLTWTFFNDATRKSETKEYWLLKI